MYVFLERSIKNVGDFLIREYGKKVLKHLKPDKELVELKSFKKLDDKIDLLNEAELIIINGGPGYSPNMYPKVYPLVEDLNRIKTPITYLGGGWRGFPGDEISVENYKFSNKSKTLLEQINTGIGGSCRDFLTQRALKNNGYDNFVMTGCPVWYDTEHIGERLKIPEEIQKIVFTPPANQIYLDQSLKIIEILSDLFSNAKKYCSFHRGIEADEHTPKSKEKFYKKIAAKAEKEDFIVKDTSYDTRKLDFYQDCDLHVGYRVHGHLYFLAHRLPSLLIEEDGRGSGANETLGLPRLPAWRRRFFYEKIPSKYLGYTPITSANGYLPSMVKNTLNEELENDFKRIKYVSKKIDDYFENMKKFVNRFPD